jgi:restriction system protein
VLSNSVYPDTFPVSYDHQFDIGSRELTLKVTVPGPSSIPTVKEYRYVKAKDEIVPTALPVKEQKERYANAVLQVALRTFHEIFEADRAGKIRSVALTVNASHIAPATGQPEDVPLVVVAADRETFTTFDLANVVPHATLTHLGAALSKSPFDLTPADTSAGVRMRGR